MYMCNCCGVLYFSSIIAISIVTVTPGDWVEGKKEGRGEETSQLGGYKGQWKNDQKDGSGEEKTLVGTTFIGMMSAKQ